MLIHCQFPRQAATIGIVATCLAGGFFHHAGAADSRAEILRVDLVDSSGETTRSARVSADASRVFLLPSGTRALLSAEPPAALVAEPPVASDEGVSVIEEQVITHRRWATDAGRLHREAGGEILWLPGPEGQPGRVSLELSRQFLVGEDADEPEEQTAPDSLSASATFLPALYFDRNGDGTLGGSVIGIYPNEHGSGVPGPVQRNRQAYAPPTSFYLLDDSTEGLPLGRYMTFGQFHPEVFSGEGPRYVAHDPRLEVFWDALVAEVEGAGRNRSALRILRGYVSPQERLRLERMGVRLAEFSRYQYGDALAIIYDNDHDYRMDDLTGDGEVTREDAAILAEWVENALREAGLAGGIGTASSFEGPNHIGTPYVHADLRGWFDRWQE